MITGIAKRGDPFRLEAALKQGGDPNAVCCLGYTALMLAAREGHFGCVHVLARYGAELDAVDDRGDSVLVHAGSFAMRKFLLELGVNPRGGTGKYSLAAFLVEFNNFDFDTVRLLCDFGADPQERTRSGSTIEQALGASAEKVNDEALWGDACEETVKTILRLSENLTMTPEEFVGNHPRLLIWSLHAYHYQDARMTKWTTEVGRLLSSPAMFLRCVEDHYSASDREEALLRLRREVRVSQRRIEIKAKEAEYAAMHALEFGGPREA